MTTFEIKTTSKWERLCQEILFTMFTHAPQKKIPKHVRSAQIYVSTMKTYL